ncbi:hypothetical protein [Rhizobium ruizarguesonis]|uniref:hypothetical protein n=1 Tax=Rhizobium ruizarguesonis TaxID=2081791 RepID=UPI0003F4F4B0|nr:hypothetical protein [Rhizobium ruizarguesonis]UFW96237.1 hypothetical protein RlegTA1_09335 [Rhizobium ruizarguesonis]
MNREIFYAALRRRGSGVFGTSLKPSQKAGLEAVLDEAEKRSAPIAHLAYMLATDYHETARTMQPIAEYGKGKGKPYGKKGKYGQAQYGRGLVQLTWDRNYERADNELGLKGALLKNFDLAMTMKVAVAIMFSGMEEGWFTGKKLSQYLSGSKKDYVGARRIINGTDKAAQIAEYARSFEAALVEAGYAETATKPAPVAPMALAAVPEAKTDKTTVEIVQRKLFEKGYTEVGSRRADGSFDGEMGKMTRGAITVFRQENELPPGDFIDQDLLNALDTAPDRKLARNDASAQTVRQAVPEVRSNWLVKIGAVIAGAFSSIGAFFDGIMGNLGIARGYVDNVKDYAADVPGYVWMGAVVAVAGGVYLVARHGERKGVEAYQSGERR